MRICIDSCVFIRRLQRSSPEVERLFALIGPALQLVIPRLVALEVTRNLRSVAQVRLFYQLFQDVNFAHIVDEPVPMVLVQKYTLLGLPGKADAFIGAFAEWMQVQYLISDNRHFLRQLHTDAFAVVEPVQFLALWDVDL